MIIYWDFLHKVISNFACPFEIAGNVREVAGIQPRKHGTLFF